MAGEVGDGLETRSAMGELNRRLAPRGWRWVCGQVPEVAPAYRFEAKIFDGDDGLVLTTQGSSEEEALDKLVQALRSMAVG